MRYIITESQYKNLIEQKMSKKETFQELIDDKLEYIKKSCESYNSTIYNDGIGIGTCGVVDIVDGITVDEVIMISGARTDLEGNMYDATPGIYIKLIINLHSASNMYDFDDLIYDLKHMLRKSTGIMVVFDYRINNTFTQ